MALQRARVLGHSLGFLGMLLVVVAVLVGVFGGIGTATQIDSPSGEVETAAQTDSEHSNVTVAVTANDTVTEMEEIEARIENSTDRSKWLVLGQRLLVAIESESLADDLENRTGTLEERFFTALDENASVSLSERNPGPNRAPIKAGLGPKNTTVSQNGTTTYLSIDTSAINFTYGGLKDGKDASFRQTAYAVSFSYENDSTQETAVRETSTEIKMVKHRAAFVDDYSVLHPRQTNFTALIQIPPDRKLGVLLVFENGSVYTETQNESLDDIEKTFRLNLGNETSGGNYTLALRHDGVVVDRQSGVLRTAQANLSNPTVSVVDAEYYAGLVNVTATLSHGGEVIVLDETGKEIGLDDLSPGTKKRLSIKLRTGTDGKQQFDPETLRIRAVREVDGIERPYAGPRANYTLDVSEYEWHPAAWTPEDNGNNSETGDANGTTPEPTDTEATGQPSDETTMTTPTASETISATPTVGEEKEDTDAGLTGAVLGFGVLGVFVLGGTGYVLRRRR